MRSNIRAILAPILTVLLAAGVTSAAPAGDAPPVERIATSVRPSVVEIVGTLEASGETSYGTGFTVRENDLVVTNAHVVRGAGNLMVRTLEGALLASVTVLETRDDLDLAVLRVIGLKARPLELSRDGIPPVGSPVVAVGHPRGYEFTVSNGIVSARRALKLGGVELIQTTAPISPGSSGGPLLDERSRVVGVCSLTLTEGQNINFAVPASHLDPVLDAALAFERGMSDGSPDGLPPGAVARLARRHRQQGDLARAQEIVRRGLGRFPEDVALLEEAAEVAWSRGQAAEARALVQRIDGLAPGHAGARQIRATLLAADGRCEEAAVEARASLGGELTAGKRAEAHAVLAECLGRLGDVEGALVHVDQALRSDAIAEIPDYHALRAFLLQAAGRADEADDAAVHALVVSGWDPLVSAALRERGLPRLVEVVSFVPGDDGVVRGVVRNRGPVALGQVTLTAEGFDAERRVVATGTAVVEPARLVPGQTGAFEIRLLGARDATRAIDVRVVDFTEP